MSDMAAISKCVTCWYISKINDGYDWICVNIKCLPLSVIMTATATGGYSMI